VLLGLVGARDEPIAGGRHKVFGHYDLAVIPQTSTIASHLPRAVGVAFSIGRSAKLGVPCAWPRDAIAVASFGDGVPMSLRAGRKLAADGIGARVFDLRWLAPLPEEQLLAEARRTGRVLVVDETRRSGGVSEGVITALADGGFTGRIARVCAADSYVPLGDAASLVLVSEPEIEAAARRLLTS
jgi:transketolase C-terminal domain/subunit